MPQNTDLNSNQLNVVSSSLSLINNVANQYIVRPTGTTPTSGINGFVFDFLGEEAITMESEITDHYVEDNYAIQDHIAQKPIKYIAKGFIGELINIFPSSLLSILTTIQTLDAVPGLSPVFSAQANQVYNQISATGSQIVNVIGQAQSIYSLISGVSTTANRQQNAYNTFINFWQNRVNCTIETPWGVLYSMYIERVEPVQPENSQIISEFSVTFKQIRLTTTLTTPLTITNQAGSGVKSPVTSSANGNSSQ
jgi:hypothetical protein